MVIETGLAYSRYRELRDDDPYEREMIAGEEFCVPSPSYLHQWVRDLLAFLLRQFVRERGLGAVVSAVGLVTGEAATSAPAVSRVLPGFTSRWLNALPRRSRRASRST